MGLDVLVAAVLCFTMIGIIFNEINHKNVTTDLVALKYKVDLIDYRTKRQNQPTSATAISGSNYPHALERQFSDALREYYNGRIHGGEVPGYPEAPSASTAEPIYWGLANQQQLGCGNGALAQSAGTSSVQCAPYTVPGPDYLVYNADSAPTYPTTVRNVWESEGTFPVVEDRS